MNGLVITGWSVLSSAGIGGDALAKRLAGVDLDGVAVDPGTDLGHLDAGPLPSPTGHAVPDLDARARLGRKGTGAYDRATTLAVVSCQEAMRDAGITIDESTRTRTGVALGTSLGSFQSTSDYTRATLENERPYLVNPLLFPNTVMNCAAGQMAIRFGLRGVNATLAGGAMAFLNALRYSGNAIGRGYADVMLAGAVEEYTPHRAWAAQLTGSTAVVPCGEACAVFVLAGARTPGWVGARRVARVLAVSTGFGPGGGEHAERALAGCVTRALRSAAVPAEAIARVFTGEVDEADRGEYGAVVQALGRWPKRIMVKRLFGECDAASGAMALAVLLAAARNGAEAEGHTLLTARGSDGAVGAAVLVGAADAGADRE